MVKPPRSVWVRYLIAVGFVALASAARWLLGPVLGDRAPSSVYILATLFTAAIAGFGPSLLALGLGFFVVATSWYVFPWDDWLTVVVGFALNFALGLAIIFYVHLARVRRDQLERQVADRRRAEEGERAQAQRIRTTLASIADAVAVADAAGHVTALNPVAATLTGWTAAEALGRPLKEVFRTVDADTLGTDEMPIAEVLREGAVVRGGGPTMLVARDGSVWPVEHSTAPLKDDDGSIDGVVLVFRDITDRRRAEARLAEQTSVAEALHRVGGRLAAELDLQKIVELVIEETVAITRAAFGAFFYDDVEDEPGRGEPPRRGPLRLYASTGPVPAGFPPKRAVGAAFRGERVVRIDDANTLPRDSSKAQPLPAPAPAGGPREARSIMAVPVVSRSGHVLGAMVLGHHRPGMFRSAHERLSSGVASQAAVAIDNARLYRAAQESEQRFRQLAENVSDVFWMYESPGGRMLYVGPAYQTIWGRSCQSLYEDPLSFLQGVHPDDVNRVVATFPRREHGEVTAEEFRIIQPNGSLRWIWDRGFPIKDETGRVVRVAGIAEDITARKTAEESLRESDRRKTEFLAMLAHELRNPLAPIRNALHLMRLNASSSGADDDEHAMVERQVMHMTRLIDDLLDVSRISRGKIGLKRQTVNLAEVVARAVGGIRRLAEESGHTVTVTLPDEPVRLSADPTRLEQILGNLLNNAVKYTDSGGTIGLAVYREGLEVAISVRDTGIGMPRELLARVFDLFVQGRHRSDRAQGGLGIGLSLVHTLVTIHGGTVSAHSDGPGLGSEFIVRLPTLPDAPPSAPSALSVNGVKGRSPRGGLPARHRVLVVDDNRDAATSLVRLLTRIWGQDVKIAHDGQTALAIAGDFLPELVLLDIGLPGMSGYDIARELRARPEFASTLLIALTGWGQDEDRRKSTEAGFDRHMVKPIEPDMLGDLLSELDVVVSP